MKTHIDRLRDLLKKAEKERNGPKPTLFGEWPEKNESVEERRRVEAMNLVLEANGCNLVNVEEELKKEAAAASDLSHSGRSGRSFHK